MTSIIILLVCALVTVGVVYSLNKRSNNSSSKPTSGGSTEDATLDSDRNNHQELL